LETTVKILLLVIFFIIVLIIKFSREKRIAVEKQNQPAGGEVSKSNVALNDFENLKKNLEAGKKHSKKVDELKEEHNIEKNLEVVCKSKDAEEHQKQEEEDGIEFDLKTAMLNNLILERKKFTP